MGSRYENYYDHGRPNGPSSLWKNLDQLSDDQLLTNFSASWRFCD
jgi:hypothetical protein